MTQAEVALLRRRHARLLAAAGGDEPTTFLDITRDDRTDQLEVTLRRTFDGDPGLAAIGLRAADGGGPVGTVTRASVGASAGVAADPGELGAADRAGLPGHSTQFRALVFACARCGATAVRSFYDARDLPLCEATQPAHGPMELRP